MFIFIHTLRGRDKAWWGRLCSFNCSDCMIPQSRVTELSEVRYICRGSICDNIAYYII